MVAFSTNSPILKVLISAILLALSVAVTFLFFHQPPVIAYVDSAKMLNGYQAMIDGRKTFQKKSHGWQTNVDTLAAGLQQSIKGYERKAAGMTPKERSLSQQLLGGKQKQLADYQRAIQQKGREEEAKDNEKILITVNAFLARYGKEHGYDLILIASPAGTIAYAKP
ncbi:MAG: OmpH family outer membrane protein, partial [Bacteroidota bacterium]|nr:OmpH family outer membrane protein [Bacteroidota bacterium]